MYSADKPISNSNDDVLGRRPFARQLSKAILSLGTTDNFTIGLFGKWGTGKTSLINMAVEEIDLLAARMTNDTSPIVIKFEPWNFVDSDNLIAQFFNHLKNELKLKDRSEILGKVGEALEEYSNAIEFVESIPVVGKYASFLKYTMTLTGKKLKDKTNQSNVLHTKEKLSKELEKLNKKIVIIIDDIDRLSNNQIRLIFQLVSSVAGLPNLIYLLSMDREVVVRALESVQECDGNEYLEKIVQIPFEIPEIDREKVLEMLFHKLDEIMKSKTNTIFSEEHWSKVFRTCVEPYILTIRDVNRVINSFYFKYDMSYSEVDFADLFGVTVLQIMDPEIIKWIINNSKELCGSSYDYKGVVYAEQQKKKQVYLEKFQRITKNAENMLNVLCTFFPKFAKEVDHYYESITDDELRRQCRLAHEDKFSFYFNLNIEKLPISRELMQESFFKYSIEEVKELIELINNKDMIISYLQELRSNIQYIPYERIPFFVEILYRNSYWFKGVKEKSIMSFSAQRFAEWCINDLIKRLKTKEEKFILLKDIIENADLYTLHTVSIDINRIELGFGRLAGKEEKVDQQFINLEHLLILEKLYSERLKELLKIDSIFDLDSMLFVVYLWRNFDETSCKEYIGKILLDNDSILKFIVRLSSSWNGTNGKGWTFNEENYKEFVSKEEILKAIEETTYTDKKALLTEIELIKLASFVLNLNLASMDHVSEKDAKELVNQWANNANNQETSH
ncbi:MAG: ATPase associated with various cellular family protein [Bacillales bacterium]|jgi:antitoxin component HigA of HigAB toxin-antitoxin module|nr:ATPase associated with various cellular family protein [Bacillales bacterium]